MMKENRTNNAQDAATRAILHGLNKEKPQALRQLHEAASLNFDAPMIARHVTGRWTARQIGLAIAPEGYDIFRDCVMICARYRRNHYRAGVYYLLTLSGGTVENMSVRYARDGLDDFYRKSDANDLRKSDDGEAIIIAQHPEHLRKYTPRTASSRFDRSARYAVESIIHGYRTGDPCDYIASVDISAAGGYRGRVPLSGWRRDISDIIDKSGYIVAISRAEREEKARAIRAQREKDRYIATDHSAELSTLAEEVEKRRAELVEKIAAAKTSDELDKLADGLKWYGRGAAAMLRKYERLAARDAAKEYRSNEAFENDANELRAMLAEA